MAVVRPDNVLDVQPRLRVPAAHLQTVKLNDGNYLADGKFLLSALSLLTPLSKIFKVTVEIQFEVCIAG